MVMLLTEIMLLSINWGCFYSTVMQHRSSDRPKGFDPMGHSDLWQLLSRSGICAMYIRRLLWRYWFCRGSGLGKQLLCIGAAAALAALGGIPRGWAQQAGPLAALGQKGVSVVLKHYALNPFAVDGNTKATSAR